VNEMLRDQVTMWVIVLGLLVPYLFILAGMGG
jgi:hypothetical protein